jgi:protein-disulfide isomerase
MIRELLRRHPNELRFVFRHLPLPELHPHAVRAAQAAEAAAAQDRFWEMHDLLFANQKELLPADLVRYAQELRLEIGRFEAELADGSHVQRIDRDVRSADAAGVVGTPTFFINGVQYRGKRDLESLDAALSRAVRLGEARAKLAVDGRADAAEADQVTGEAPGVAEGSDTSI